MNVNSLKKFCFKSLNHAIFMASAILFSSCNGATSSAVHVIRDAIAPSVTGLANDTVPTQSKTWTWGCSEVCTYQYVIDTTSNTTPSSAYGATVTDSQASGSNTYYIHVRAKDAAGNVSAVVHASAIVDNTAPTAPTGITLGAVPGGTDKSPTISWTASTDVGGVNYYQVQLYKTSDDSVVAAWTTMVSGAQFTGLSLSTSTAYYAKVLAVDLATNVSSISAAGAWTSLDPITHISTATTRNGIFTVSVPAKSTIVLYSAGNNGGASGGGLTWTNVATNGGVFGDLVMYVAYSVNALTNASIICDNGGGYGDAWIDVYTGVSSTTPIDRSVSYTATGNNPNISLTPTVSGSVVIGALADYNGGAITVSTGYTAGDVYIPDMNGYTLLGIYGTSTATSGQATAVNFNWIWAGDGLGIAANLINGN